MELLGRIGIAGTDGQNSMKEAIAEYHDARIRIVKAIRKLNYRIGKKDIDIYKEEKRILLLEMRRMDRILREILERKDGF